MEATKNNVGRPKGYKVTEETKQQISKSMKNYYENMTEKQKQVRDNCNRKKREMWSEALQMYYQKYNIQK